MAPIVVNDFVVPLLNTIMIMTMAAYIAYNLHEVSFVAKPIVVSPEKSNLDNFSFMDGNSFENQYKSSK